MVAAKPRTKIVCTIGPASREPEILQGLMQAGMSVARLNFSHGSQAQHSRTIASIRATSRRLGAGVAILQDLAGFKVRIGEIAGGGVSLDPAQKIVLTARDVPGDAREISVSYPDLVREVRAGDTLLLSDGAIELEVDQVSGGDLSCRVVVGGWLGSRKGVNVPGRSIGGSGLTAKDREDLAFGLEQGVDHVAMSFVRRADDIREAKDLIAERGHDTPVIAKIENRDALDEIDAILAVADGIMVARGDLGVGIPIARIPNVQKLLIARANRAAKPVITATHMLRSMVESPRPTRAEVTDVANSILDGTDAIMLSEETAVGAYPVEAAQTMADVAVETETAFPHDRWTFDLRQKDHDTVAEAIAFAVCRMADDVDAAAILTCTSSGSTARAVARFRPRRPVLALTPRETTYRRLALTWGVVPCLGPATTSTDDLIQAALRAAGEESLVAPQQRVVITAGVPAGTPGHTNLIKVEEIDGPSSS
ncbi:MAG: pyruvate kinase [Acidobacteriota bacterium]